MQVYTDYPNVFQVISRSLPVSEITKRGQEKETVTATGVHVKAVWTSPFFQYLSAYLINHCLAVLCNFLSDFGAYWERDIFSQRIG